MLYKHNWKKRFCWKWGNFDNFGENTFEKVTIKLTNYWESQLFEMLASKRFEEIARLKETIVKVPIQLEGKKIEAWKGENSKFSKEKHFLPRLVAKANLAAGMTRACDLWPVACGIPILLIFFQGEQKRFSAMPTLDNLHMFSFQKLIPN